MCETLTWNREDQARWRGCQSAAHRIEYDKERARAVPGCWASLPGSLARLPVRFTTLCHIFPVVSSVSLA
eukprot:676125-Rhodomonas_salina.1